MTDRKASFAKRKREVDQKDRVTERLGKKAERAKAKENRDPNADPDIDPDLVGIVAGPQPKPDDDYPPELKAILGDVPSDDSANTPIPPAASTGHPGSGVGHAPRR